MSNQAISPELIDLSFVPRARENASVELEGEGLLFSEERGSWHLLSSTAMVIWQCCDGSGTIEALAQDLARAYETDLATVRPATLETIRHLGREGLLEGVEGEPQSEDQPQIHNHDHDHEEEDRAGNEPRFLPVPAST